MTKYHYKGESEVQVAGVGIVKPNSVIETKIAINHPLFEKVDKNFKVEIPKKSEKK